MLVQSGARLDPDSVLNLILIAAFDDLPDGDPELATRATS
jgi:hypothetical protein